MKTAKLDPVPVLEPGRVVELPIAVLMPDPKQPRTEFPEAGLRELADDLLQRGCRQALLVRSDYVIVDGERRWRAAGLAKIASLPCLLDRPAAEENPELERILDQAAINDQREPLSVLDWARLLRRLTEEHGIAVKDLPEILEARGFKKLSRPYISNLMRLMDLPEWAQDLIRAGALPPADGKYILMCKPHPPAMAALEKLVRKNEKIKEAEPGQRVDINLEWLVGRAYRDTAIELSASWGDDAPRFKWTTECKACPNRHEAVGDHWCLDSKCFATKQERARATDKTSDGDHKRAKPKKPTGPTKVKPNEDGIVSVARMDSDKYHSLTGYGVRFEPAIHCVGCEHNRPAVHYKDDTPGPTCFNPPCFAEKQRNGSREEGIALWLDERLLPLVQAKLAGNFDLQFQLLTWMALGGPTHTRHERKVDDVLRGETHRARKALNLRDPAAVIQAYAGGALNGEAIARAGVLALLADRGHFYAFARHLGIEITPEIASLDAEYLELKRKPELLALFADPRLDAFRDAESLRKAKLPELVAFGRRPEVVGVLGVPPDVRALYQNLGPVVDPDADWEDDEEVSGETDDDTAYDDAGEDTPVGEDDDD